MAQVKLTIWAYKPAAFTGYSFLMGSAVSLWTQSEWCHIGFSLADYYYEADFADGVVRLTRVPDGAVNAGEFMVDETVVDFADRQVGKKYDVWGALGFVLGDTKEDREFKKLWFCSELAVAAMRKSKLTILETYKAWQIFPGMLVDALFRSCTHGQQETHAE